MTSFELRSNRGRSGFSLGELLIVIMIFAVLAAALFPLFATAREKAGQASCESNLTQLARAMTMYAQDYDTCFPQGAFAKSSGPVPNDFYNYGMGWAGQLYPYAKTRSVFICPSDTYAVQADSNGASLGGTMAQGGNAGSVASVAAANAQVISYAYNANFGIGLAANKPVRTSALKASANTILFFEAMGCLADPTNAEVGWVDGSSPASNGTDILNVNSNGPPGFCRAATGMWAGSNMAFRGAQVFGKNLTGRHNGGANYAFADGHIKFLLPGVISAGTDNTTGDCGVFPGDYTNGGWSSAPAASAAKIGACASGGPAATFSVH